MQFLTYISETKVVIVKLIRSQIIQQVGTNSEKSDNPMLKARYTCLIEIYMIKDRTRKL